MLEFDPRTLAAECGGAWHGVPAAPITGFAIDSRALHPGDMFVALRSEKRDGHGFVAEAALRGAGAALVARADASVPVAQLVVPDPLAALHAIAHAHRARFPGPVVAVTGSAGKTSTKDLLAELLGEGGEVLATHGNLNNHLGVPLTLLRSDASRHRCAVVEAGISGPGEMDVLGALIAPDAVVVTRIAAAHLDGLGSIEGVAQEKGRLLAHLRSGGVAVFPASCLAHRPFDERRAQTLVAMSAEMGSRVLPPGMRPVPYAVRHESEVTRITVTWNGSPEPFELRRLTSGMASNAALALALAMHLGIGPEILRARLPRWRPAALRGEVRREPGRVIYLDCYNANPASMLDAMEGFLALAPAEQPRLYVVGCMEELGADAALLHRAAGQAWPLRDCDQLVVFGTYADELAAGARKSAPGAVVRVNPDRDEVAGLVRTFTGAIFLKGSRRYALESLLGEASSHPQATEAAA